MRENYLAKWLNNELSEEELKEFRKSAGYSTYQKIAEVSTSLTGPDFDVEKALESTKQARNNPTDGKVVRMSPYGQLLKIAATLLILLGITYFYYNFGNESIQADYAQRSEVVLPDHSEVTLNAGSDLSYNDKKWDSRRHIKLRGEAFFKVAKGQKFTVETEAGTVTVLGTQFNVLQRDNIFIVSCYEGRVKVVHNDTALELPAGTGYRVVHGERDKFVTKPVSKPSWMTEESTFRSMPLSFVLEELQRQYDLKVETKDVDREVLFTGTFSNTNLNLALQSISAPLQLAYTLEGDKVLIYAQNTP